MRSIILNLSLLCSSIAFGQTEVPADRVNKIKVTATFSAIPGKTYVDSVEMDMTKTYLNPDNIREVKTVKGKGASRGEKATLISRKNGKPFVGLSDIKLRDSLPSDTSLPTVYVIDGILIEDTLSIRLEATAIKSIDILKPSEHPELFHHRKMILFVLTTNAKSWNKHSH